MNRKKDAVRDGPSESVKHQRGALERNLHSLGKEKYVTLIPLNSRKAHSGVPSLLTDWHSTDTHPIKLASRRRSKACALVTSFELELRPSWFYNAAYSLPKWKIKRNLERDLIKKKCPGFQIRFSATHTASQQRVLKLLISIIRTIKRYRFIPINSVLAQ